MRTMYSALFIVLTASLAFCAVKSFRAHKRFSSTVSRLLVSLIPPMLGNAIIVATTNRLAAIIGYYVYFLGMNSVMSAVFSFALTYCGMAEHGRQKRRIVDAVLAADAVQMMLNPFLHHAFLTETTTLENAAYYRLLPLAGQTVHRVVDYAVFLIVLGIFIYRVIHSPKVDVERYAVILAAMVFTGLWETFYIFSRTPIDRSMIGFGVFGLLIFYFALYYKPVRLLDKMLVGIASQLPDALFFFDLTGSCFWINEPGRRLLRMEKEDDPDLAISLLKSKFGDIGENREGDWETEKTLREDHELRYYSMERHDARDDRGQKAATFLSVRDITREMTAYQTERYNASHDRLTGLYTREHLYHQMREKMKAHPGEIYYALYLDVKDFKIINDIFGTSFGDQVLQQIAETLRRTMPEGALYGRLTGDTFGACVPRNAFRAADFSREMRSFTVSDGANEQPILMHLGVYEITEPGIEPSVMFDRAHMALTAIQHDYNTRISYYSEEMRDSTLWSQEISLELPAALAEGQIRAYLQPIVNGAGKAVGAEALIRWMHPEHGLLFPAQFIPVFEKNGMIADVDRYMWEQACAILARWKAEGREQFISVNISPRDFYFMDLSAELQGLVSRYDIDPKYLRLEITETVMMTDIEKRIRILEDLKARGFLIEMDDFGSGYSSLNLLNEMPVDVVKVDMLFVRKAKDNLRARTILKNVIHMTEEMGIDSLTEGVETEEQEKMLGDMGCKLFQGFYFSKAVPVEEFESMWKEKG